jgi:hypothetical protein
VWANAAKSNESNVNSPPPVRKKSISSPTLGG